MTVDKTKQKNAKAALRLARENTISTKGGGIVVLCGGDTGTFKIQLRLDTICAIEVDEDLNVIKYKVHKNVDWVLARQVEHAMADVIGWLDSIYVIVGAKR